jgi:hypothetical protein
MMKKSITCALAVVLLTGNAVAAKLPPREVPGTRPAYTADKLLPLEGFEGAFPPAGWSHGVTDAAHTWMRDTLVPYSGTAATRVAWQAGAPQDETLSFTWPVAAGEDLFFATQGSVEWTANADFTVEVNGAPVYGFHADHVGGSWVWDYVQVDLAAWEGTSPTFTFRYAGIDGADHYLDAVRVGQYSPPPPPAAVDFCAAVYQGYGTHFTGNTCDGANTISLLGCADYAENGLEHYYEIEVPAGCFLTANVTYGAADGALWLLDSCAAPGGAFGCLGYADATLAGGQETMAYTNATTSMQVVYLVIDSWGSSACGNYTFDFISDCAVATESESFGSVKAMFR